MDRFYSNFVTGAIHFDDDTFSLMEHREEQRQAEKVFIDKLSKMLDDYLKKNRDPTEFIAPDPTSDDAS